MNQVKVKGKRCKIGQNIEIGQKSAVSGVQTAI